MSASTVLPQTDITPDIEAVALPFARIPVLDRDMQLVAYDICYQGECVGNLTQATLQLFGHSGLGQLTGKHLAFVTVNEELLRGHDDLLRLDQHMGPRVDAQLAMCDDILAVLREMAARGVPVMIDNLVWPDASTEGDTRRLDELVQLAQYASFDARRHDEPRLLHAVTRLRAASVVTVATHLEDHADHRMCLDLGFDAFEGRYLFKPAPNSSETMKPNRLNVLRLLGAVQNPENGPIELEELIRNDAVLSYKLLSCVNSAYFSLPRELKSLQQAAVYFGVTRIRNWVYSMSLGDLDDAPPELLKQALLRARMSELLARHLPREQREMAFTMGLFSLLDTIMGAPMARVLEDVPVAELVRNALVDGSGPLATVLQQIRAWESGYVVRVTDAAGNSVDLAEAYLRSVEWAEHVYRFAQKEAA